MKNQPTESWYSRLKQKWLDEDDLKKGMNFQQKGKENMYKDHKKCAENLSGEQVQFLAEPWMMSEPAVFGQRCYQATASMSVHYFQMLW